MKYEYRREPLLTDEVNAIESACQKPRDRLILFTLLDTGLRVAELAGLRRDNIDFQMHRLIFKGKGKKRRVLAMSPRIRPLLESHFAVADTFPASKRTIQRTLKRLANQAAILRPASPHVMRHTFACNVLQKGISLPTLQMLLGHLNLATTQIYTNLSPEVALDEFARKW